MEIIKYFRTGRRKDKKGMYFLMTNYELKRERFKKVSEARKEKITSMLDLLANCSNKNNYIYKKSEVSEIFDEIQASLDRAKLAFDIQDKGNLAEQTKNMFEKEYTYLNGFERNVNRYRNKEAVVFPLEDKSWTYGELEREANKLANAYINSGIGANDVILYQMKNSPAFIFNYIASHKIGAVNAPLNYRLAPAELAYIIESNKPSAFMFDCDLSENVKKALEISSYKPPVLIVYDHTECYFGEACSGFIRFDDFVNGMSDKKPEIKNDFSTYNETTRFFTSGSTGKQKGVPVTSINEILSSHDVMMHLPLNSTDKTLNMTPWFHRGSFQGITSTLYAGGTVFIMPHFDAKACLKYVEKYRLTFLIGVPTTLEYLVKMQKSEGADLSSLNGIITMGAPLRRADCIRYQNVLTPNIFNGYGTTETLWNIFLRPFDLPEKAGTTGSMCVDDDVRVVHVYKDRKAEPDDVVACDNTEEGEIIIKSFAKSSYTYSGECQTGYYKDYLYTGDIGVWDENHFITMTGRKDYMINSSGENINPVQIEKVINKMNGVRICAVTSVGNKTRGEMVVGYIVRKNDNLTAREIDRFCLASVKLANYKRPRYYRFIQEIPWNNNDIDRNILSQMARDDLENGLLIRV